MLLYLTHPLVLNPHYDSVSWLSIPTYLGPESINNFQIMRKLVPW